MNALVPIITFGNLVRGFPEWYKQSHQEVAQVFSNMSDDFKENFETVEDFGIELFHEVNNV